MINAQFSSKSKGTKSFTIDDTTFGWDSVVSMYESVLELRKGKPERSLNSKKCTL